MAENPQSINPEAGSYPLLMTLDAPEQLRALHPEQLPQVCTELRNFLIQSLAVNPGHFASSMGAVELTVALHYVFHTPYDRIVWDVGHQAYAHKILTGRRDRFATNRRFRGLSGFPNPKESEYDTFSAGHASNSISAALGMAVATKMNHEEPQRKVVAVIGDASISGGLAFEGINNAANTENDLLIVLNDNDMSIDPNVGSMHRYLAHITTSRTYNSVRYKLYRLLRRAGLVSDRGRGLILRFNNALKSLLAQQQNIFEGLNIRYFGPIDGHDLPTLLRTLNDIKDLSGPKILHVKTVKGKGYAPAERDPATWHAPGKFDPATGERTKKDGNGCAKYQDVFGQTLLQLAQQNPKIVGITAAMPTGTSISVMKEAMPKRVFDVGISEGHAVTFAGGLAREGLMPFVAIYSAFLQRAYDNIINDIALQRLPITFCIDRAGLVGEDGPTHHGAFDIAYMRAVPKMVLAAPRNEAMLRRLLYTAQLPGRDFPMAIRYPRGAGKDPEWASEPLEAVEIGRGERLRQGFDVVVVSTGPIADDVEEAIRLAESLRPGISVAHYSMTFIKPLDGALMQEILSLGKRVITVEDGVAMGGMGSAVEEWLNDHATPSMPAPHVTRLGLPDSFVTHGTVAELRKLVGLDPTSIAQTILCSSQ